MIGRILCYLRGYHKIYVEHFDNTFKKTNEFRVICKTCKKMQVFELERGNE